MHGPYLKWTSTTIMTEICTASEQPTVDDPQQPKPEVSCHACFNFSCLHSKSLTLHSGNSPPSTECTSSTFIKYFNVMRSFEIYAIWPQASIYLYRHTCAMQSQQCEARSGSSHLQKCGRSEIQIMKTWRMQQLLTADKCNLQSNCYNHGKLCVIVNFSSAYNLFPLCMPEAIVL